MAKAATVVVLLCAGVAALTCVAAAQQASIDPGTVRAMQRQIRDTLAKYYYDPTLHGVDLNAPAIQARLATAKSTSDVFAALALPLLDLEDQHTLFIPPPRVTQHDYGWSMIAIGNGVYVDYVAPKSDAAVQGLAVGDQVLVVNSIGNFSRASREECAVMSGCISVTEM